MGGNQNQSKFKTELNCNNSFTAISAVPLKAVYDKTQRRTLIMNIGEGSENG